MNATNRRGFLKRSLYFGLASAMAGVTTSCSDLLSEETIREFVHDESRLSRLFFKISLAEWSLHKTLWAGKLDHLDFVSYSKQEFGISAVEYVNQFFIDKAENVAYLNEMNKRAGDHGVEQLLIMIDQEGSLATLKEDQRKTAIENHYKWVDAAKYLGCHSIRVNAYGKGNREDVLKAAVDSLGTLATYAAKEEINIVVENHGGYSSDPTWLSEVMQEVDMPNCGTLPDFGNFFITMFPYRAYDRVSGTQQLLPWAKGISAKSRDFGRNGKHKTYDFLPLLRVIKESGYTGHIGIEYEGYKLNEAAGIKATQELLIREGLLLQ